MSDGNESVGQSLWDRMLHSGRWQGIGGVVGIAALVVSAYTAVAGPPPVLVNVIAQIPGIRDLQLVKDLQISAAGEAVTTTVEVAATAAIAPPTMTPTSTPTATPSPTATARPPAVVTAVPATETRSAATVEDATIRKASSVSFFGGDLRVGLSSVSSGGAWMIVSPSVAATVERYLSVGAACVHGAGSDWFRVELVSKDVEQVAVRASRVAGPNPAGVRCA